MDTFLTNSIKTKHCGILIIDISAFCSFVALPYAFTSPF